MGQEIESARFSKADFRRFAERLAEETRLVQRMAGQGCHFDESPPSAGFELEAWLIDARGFPAPINTSFLERLDDGMASPELGCFNVELNSPAHALRGRVFSLMHDQLRTTWRRACDVAAGMDAGFLMIGILPTLRPEHLNLANMSALKRFHALNREVFRARRGRPLDIHISGRESLHHAQDDVMLEAATTSFQLHLQTPLTQAHHVYNAALLASAPVVALAANSPFLFGRALWEETRIPVFEQSVDIGGYGDAARGPLHRVSFGSGYARQSIIETFVENQQHFPLLLPTRMETAPEELAHLRLHNGTIWRWNRPLIGFSPDGKPHVRIEHRVVPAGPSLADSMANAAFLYGLVSDLCTQPGGPEDILGFAAARDNFYQGARHGLDASLRWACERHVSARELILHDLLPRARKGLDRLEIDAADADHYLRIIHDRVEGRMTGAHWQRAFVAAHGSDMEALTRSYHHWQMQDLPVHQWDLSRC